MKENTAFVTGADHGLGLSMTGILRALDDLARDFGARLLIA